MTSTLISPDQPRASMLAHRLLQALIVVLLGHYTSMTYKSMKYIQTSNTTGTFDFIKFHSNTRVLARSRFTVTFNVTSYYFRNFNITFSNIGFLNSVKRDFYRYFSGISYVSLTSVSVINNREMQERAMVNVTIWIDRLWHSWYEILDRERCVASDKKTFPTCQLLSTGFFIRLISSSNLGPSKASIMLHYTSTNVSAPVICNAMHTVNEQHVTISSIQNNITLPNMTCDWPIPRMHSDTFQFVSIKVHYISIGTCKNAKLQMWHMNNPTDKALITLCGSRSGYEIPLYNVTGGLRVTFVTNKHISGVEFYLVIQKKPRQNVMLRQQIKITNLYMHNISLHNLFKKFPMCPNISSYCQYIVVFVAEHGFRINIKMSPDVIGSVSAFDGPLVDYKPLKPTYHSDITGFFSVGPYLTISWNVRKMKSSSLIYYHTRPAFPRSTVYQKLFNCNTQSPQIARLGIFNLNSIMNVMINQTKLAADNYVCYIVMTVAKYLAVSMKIREIELDQIGDKCETHGIAMYDGSVNSRNKLGPFCETEKGYMKALFNPLVTTSDRVYIMMYIYAKKGDWHQHISVEITATRCSSINVTPGVLNKRRILSRDIQIETSGKNKTILMSINNHVICMSVVFHPNNDYYQYAINGIDDLQHLSAHEYVWNRPSNCTGKQENILGSFDNKLNITKMTTMFVTGSCSGIRLLKFYIGQNEKHTPQLIGNCSYNDVPNSTYIYSSVFQGVIDLFYGRKSQTYLRVCYVTLSRGRNYIHHIQHIDSYYKLKIHVYYGQKLTITEYISQHSHETVRVYERKGKPFLLTDETFTSVSTYLLVLDLSKSVVSIEYQQMAYKKETQYLAYQFPWPLIHYHYNNHSYGLRYENELTAQTAQKAQDTCVSHGGNLFSASTIEELAAMKTVLIDTWKTFALEYSNSQMDIIIGLKKTYQPDGITQWRWTDGSPLTMSDWYYPDMMNHQIPEKFQNEGNTFKVQPEDNTYQCGMMQIYSPQESTNWRAIDCNEEMLTTAYICEYPNDTSCHNNTGNCSTKMFKNASTSSDRRNLKKYKQFNTNYTCPTNWTFIQDYCWLLVNSQTRDITTCDRYGGHLANIDSLEIIHRYLTYVQHHESYGNIWIKSNGKHSCIRYRPRQDLMETEGERLEIVDAGECITTILFEYYRGHTHEYEYFLKHYYPVHCIISKSNKYTFANLTANITCAPNHVFCERESVPVATTCEVGYLQCVDMSCISHDQVCDDVNDCKTGEDEQGCELPDYWYNCSTKKERITISKYCDFFSDCSDGSDEEGCVHLPCYRGQFRCNNGQCVDGTRRCNGRHDSCIDHSDETHCKTRDNCTNGFYCGEGVCIPKGHENDRRVDCSSSIDEPYMSVYYKKGKPTDYTNCSHVEGRCSETNVGCFNRGEACVLGYDTDGRMKSCSNGAHLNNCSSFECPGRYKCPGSYCIDMKRVCNGIQDCQNKEDEAECEDTRSPGLYRCGGDQTYSIARSQVCDGEFDCLRHHSDEKYCRLPQCPSGCTCRGFYYNCEGNISHGVSITDANFSVSARSINLANNNLSTTNGFQFSRYTYLAVLRLARNQIKYINISTFDGLYNLITLDMSHNMFTTLGQNTFKHLSRLKHLFVHGNSIKELLSETFHGLSQIVMLNLSRLSISNVRTGALYGLTNLDTLDLSENDIVTIESGVFDSRQQLTRVNLTSNSLTFVHPDVFGNITAEYIETDAFRFCCFTNKTLCIKCTPNNDTYSSCDDLMANNFLRIVIWLIGWLAFIGNVTVIISRPILGIKTPSEVCIFALSCSDLLTGIYLLILASVDAHYKGRYIIDDVKWRTSNLCQLCGVLSTLSAQLSSFLLLLITLDRFIHLVFPMKAVSYTRKSAIVVCVIVFMVSFIESIIPVANKSYFGEWFYSKTAVCLAYDFDDISDGWEYTLVVFILVNLLNCIITLVCYIIIYGSIRRSSLTADPTRKADIALAKTLFLLVLTDLVCWFPIIITSLSVLTGHKVSRDMAALLAVVVLPINAALNPYLYTISSIRNAKSRQQARGQTSQPEARVRQVQTKQHQMWTKRPDAKTVEMMPLMAQCSQKAAESTILQEKQERDPQDNTSTMSTNNHDVSIQQLELQIRNLETQNRQLKEQTKEFEAQITEMMQTMIVERSEITGDNSDLNEQNIEFQQQFTESLGKLTLNETTEHLDSHTIMATDSKQNNELKERISVLEAQMRQVVAESCDLETQDRHLKERNMLLEEQMRQMATENSEIMAENRNRKEQNTLLEEQYGESTAQLAVATGGPEEPSSLTEMESRQTEGTS